MPETSKHEIKLFYCYAREDEALCVELEKHLSPLKRQYLIKNWHDREIIPGEEWAQAIDRNLSTSHLILLLISPDFMHSDYCYNKVMAKALEREKAGDCRVVPILLRPVDLEGAPFSYLRMLPTGDQPVTSWPNRDQAFQNIAIGIRKVLRDLLQSLKMKEERLEEAKISHHIAWSEKALDTAPVLIPEKRNLGIIDLSIEAALEIEADHHPVSLTELHSVYLRSNPSIKKGTTRNSFDAVINYHTINMRSRFHYPNDKRKSDAWLNRPVFKRVAPARYMLLRPDEVALFRQRIEECDPRVYQDEYNVDDLRQPQEDKDKISIISSHNEKNTLLKDDETSTYRNIDFRKFREEIARRYSFDELYILGVDVDENFEGLSGGTAQMRAQMLIEYCKNNGIFDNLVTRVLDDYPSFIKELGIQILYEDDE